MRAIILSGLSGTGKTRLRTLHPDLWDLPYVDIADVYRDYPSYGWPLVMQEFLIRLRAAFQDHETVVLEGYFLPGSPSLRLLINDLKAQGAHYEIIYLWAPPEVCQARLEAAWRDGTISDAEYRARTRTLRSVLKQQA